MNRLLKMVGFGLGALVGLILITFPSIVLGLFSYTLWQRELTFNELILAFCFGTVLLLLQGAIVEKLLVRKPVDESANNR